MNTTILDTNTIEIATELLRAIAHQLRLKIIVYLIEKGEVAVHSIYNDLNLDQSIASQQLKILKDNKVVIIRRDGKNIFYTINAEILQKVYIAIKKYDEITQNRKRAAKQKNKPI